MTRMGLGKAVAVLCVVAVFASGCKTIGWVSRKRHSEVVDRLQNALADNSRLAMENQTLGTDNQRLRSTKDDLANQIEAALSEKQSLEAKLSEQGTRTARVDQQLAQVQAKLEQLASAYPAMFQYRRPKNSLILRIQFQLGSAEIQPGGRAALARAAKVLKNVSPDYVIYIDGHTDDLPVVNPATKRDHGDLWGLATHRALTVLRALETYGISPDRMVARGFADRDPLIARKTPSARRHNRRVEISIEPKGPRALPAVFQQ